MRHWLMAGFAFILGGTSWAASYDDFVKAAALQRAGNVEQAIASYTAALNAGDLAPVYVPDAYAGRAALYLKSGKCALALADLDAALKLQPAAIEVLLSHARANSCLGKEEAALADYTAAIAVQPSAQIYMSRGSFLWFHGRFSEAAADYAKAAGLHKTRDAAAVGDTYALAWYAISANRVHSFKLEDLAANADHFDLDSWPGPLVSFFLGKMSIEKLYREAADGDGDDPKEQKCEADFFTAEWKLASDSTAAKAQLQAVIDTCPHKLIVVRAARSDLRRIP